MTSPIEFQIALAEWQARALKAADLRAAARSNEAVALRHSKGGSADLRKADAIIASSADELVADRAKIEADAQLMMVQRMLADAGIKDGGAPWGR